MCQLILMQLVAPLKLLADESIVSKTKYNKKLYEKAQYALFVCNQV